MARKGLPKKYAKMGFKKGWREYKKQRKPRASKAGNPTKTKRTKSKSNRGGSMNLGKGAGKDIMTGAAIGLVNQMIPINIAGADYIIAGMITKNDIVKRIGFITLGRSLASSINVGGILGGGGAQGGNGGGY